MSIDVVPAIQDANDPKKIFVADIKSVIGIPNNDWLPSSPLRHAEIVTEINKRNGGDFTRLVKLLKYWNSQLPETTRLKSFAVETLAATLFAHHDVGSYDEALVMFFDYIAHVARFKTLILWPDKYGVCLDTWWTIAIPDLGGSGSNLVARVDDKRCDAWIKQAIRSRDLIANAVRQEDPRVLEAAVRSALHL
jgi:hypothetical protein